jgi:hypothetical protein
MENEINNVWLYSKDFGGFVYTGLVYDLKSNPKKVYSVISDYHLDSVKLDGSIIYKGNDTLARIIWMNSSCMIIESSDTIAFHKVPNMNNKESYEFVYEFLTEYDILFKDKLGEIRIHYDTIMWENGLKPLSYLIQEPNNTFSISSWNLKVVNNSLILFNLDPNSLFQENLLLTNITNDSISALKLKYPSESFEDNAGFEEKVKKNIKFDFEYEKCVLKKIKRLETQEKTELLNNLTSKEWTLKSIDTTNSGRIAGVPRNSYNRIYPTDKYMIKYNFFENYSFVFNLNENVYSGYYRISKDGTFIELDSGIEFDDYIEILELSPEKLRTNQSVKVFRTNNKCKIYNYSIEFE